MAPTDVRRPSAGSCLGWGCLSAIRRNPITPSQCGVAHSLNGVEDFFWYWGDTLDTWTRVFRHAGQPPPQQRFVKRDENLLSRWAW